MTTQSPAPRFINPTPHGYSNAVVVPTEGKIVYITGQMARDEEGRIVGGDSLGAQTEQVFKNLESHLAAAGATFDNVVKITMLAVESFVEDALEFAEVRDRYVNTENPPASAVFLAPKLVQEGALIDIAAIAHIPN